MSHKLHNFSWGWKREIYTETDKQTERQTSLLIAGQLWRQTAWSLQRFLGFTDTLLLLITLPTQVSHVIYILHITVPCYTSSTSLSHVTHPLHHCPMLHASSTSLSHVTHSPHHCPKLHTSSTSLSHVTHPPHHCPTWHTISKSLSHVTHPPHHCPTLHTSSTSLSHVTMSTSLSKVALILHINVPCYTHSPHNCLILHIFHINIPCGTHLSPSHSNEWKLNHLCLGHHVQSKTFFGAHYCNQYHCLRHNVQHAVLHIMFNTVNALDIR